MTLITDEDLKAATTEDIETLRIAVINELERRSFIANAELATQQINQRYAEAIGRVDGSTWGKPVGAHDAYSKGSKVTHLGKTYVSTISANVWAPPGEGWREEVAAGGTPAIWVQPGSTNGYKKGNQVTFEGAVWESTIDNNVWSPTAYPTGWKKL